MLQRIKSYKNVLFVIIWSALLAMSIMEYVGVGSLMNLHRIFYLVLPIFLLIFTDLGWKIPAVFVSVAIIVVSYLNNVTPDIDLCSYMLLILFILLHHRIKAWIWIFAYVAMRFVLPFCFYVSWSPMDILVISIRSSLGWSDFVQFESLLYYIFFLKDSFLSKEIVKHSVEKKEKVKKVYRDVTGFSYLDEYKKNMKK